MAVFVAKSRTANSRFRVVRKYNPDEPRDDHGRWTDGVLPNPDKPMTPEEEAATRREWGDVRNVRDYDIVPIYRGDDPEIAESIRRYKSSMADDDAYAINRELRTGTVTPSHQKAVANLDRAFATSAGEIRDYHTKQGKDAFLYRGIDGRFPLDHLQVGDVITDKGFVSTTTDKSFAVDWVREHDKGAGAKGAVLKIVAPKGTKVLKLPDSSGQDESEVLLNRGTKFRVTRMAPNRFIEVEALR